MRPRAGDWLLIDIGLALFVISFLIARSAQSNGLTWLGQIFIMMGFGGAILRTDTEDTSDSIRRRRRVALRFGAAGLTAYIVLNVVYLFFGMYYPWLVILLLFFMAGGFLW